MPAFMAKLAGTPGVASRALQFHHPDLRPNQRDARYDAWDEGRPWVRGMAGARKERMKMAQHRMTCLCPDPALAILRELEGERGSEPACVRRQAGAWVVEHDGRRWCCGAWGRRDDPRFPGVAPRSWMAEQGVAFELAEAALAQQVGNAVVQAYQRSSMLERRRPILKLPGPLRHRLQRRQRGAAAKGPGHDPGRARATIFRKRIADYQRPKLWRATTCRHLSKWRCADSANGPTNSCCRNSAR